MINPRTLIVYCGIFFFSRIPAHHLCLSTVHSTHASVSLGLMNSGWEETAWCRGSVGSAVGALFTVGI